VSDKTARDILVEARALIAAPYGWTKGTFIRKRKVKGQEYVCYCAVGALRVAGGGVPDVAAEYVDNPCTGPFIQAFKTLESVTGMTSGVSVAYFNDRKGSKKKDILDLYDEAIERAFV
jgi:hypothetical protein